jgi:isocitrate dehydrogenase
MARQFSMPYQIPPVSLLAAAADAAGRTGSYRSLRNCLKAYIVAEVNQGNAATVAITPLQAKDSAGTGSKAIAATPIWLNGDTSVSDALAAQAAAANFTTDASLKDKLVVFEITPEAAMDMAGGFNHIALQTGASNAANVTAAALYILLAAQGVSAPTSYA